MKSWPCIQFILALDLFMKKYIDYLEKMRNSNEPSSQESEAKGQEILKSLRERQARAIIYKMAFSVFVPIVLVLAGVIALTYKIHSLAAGSVKDLNGVEILLPIGAILGGIFMVMENYLGSKGGIGFTTTSGSGASVNQRLDEIQYESQIIKKELNKKFEDLFLIIQKNYQNSNEEIAEWQNEKLSKVLIDTIQQNITPDFFNVLKKSLVSQISDDKKEQLFTISRRNDNSINRLRAEIEVLTGRANLNLVIGSTVAIAALFLLGYFVIKENFSSVDMVSVAIHFLPRLSLVVFIEFFSFFFLKLYGTSLHEIKYYQNELTNLELKGVSVVFAANYGSEADISNTIKELLATERNFKLQKGESTVELERTKFQTHDLKEILKAMAGASQKKK
jgi:hypothetical protein